MYNTSEIMETISMIRDNNLDIRTTTMGISLLDCADTDTDKSCIKIYDKICRLAGDLVRTGEDIHDKYGIDMYQPENEQIVVAIVIQLEKMLEARSENESESSFSLFGD